MRILQVRWVVYNLFTEGVIEDNNGEIIDNEEVQKVDNFLISKGKVLIRILGENVRENCFIKMDENHHFVSKVRQGKVSPNGLVDESNDTIQADRVLH